MAFFTWAHETYASLAFVLKTDDDVFNRLDLMVQELQLDPIPNLYWGFVYLYAYASKVENVEMVAHAYVAAGWMDGCDTWH